MGRIEVIKKYFGDKRKVEIAELKALSTQERQELADGAAKELGLTRNEDGSDYT